jgi:hypothetical protein
MELENPDVQDLARLAEQVKKQEMM